MALLDVDSQEYELLFEATQAVAHVPGLTCEIGVRAGGGSQVIMTGSPPGRVHIGIDPWGQLPFVYHDAEPACTPVYDNAMRQRCHAELYTWAAFEKRDLLLFTLTDEDFFVRFADGVPIYRQGERQVINQYALVHFDGSHSTEAVAREVAFFGPRSAPGAYWVFDDYDGYQLPDLSAWGFTLYRTGQRKTVWRRQPVQTTWKIMLARFPYGGTERMEIVDWTAAAVLWAARQPDIDGSLLLWKINDTPITMGRNQAVQAAINSGADILVMLDADMAPDIERETPFLPAAFEFIKSRWHVAPTIIGAPYLTAGPSYNPVMGRWRTYSDGCQVKASLYTREEAAALRGIQSCPLQGTGLMAIDMRIFTGFPVGDAVVKLPPPWFYYEFTDEYHLAKASTEDMVFMRNVTTLFAKHDLEIGFVNWDAWAYHVKTEFVGKPNLITIRNVAALCRGD